MYTVTTDMSLLGLQQQGTNPTVTCQSYREQLANLSKIAGITVTFFLIFKYTIEAVLPHSHYLLFILPPPHGCEPGPAIRAASH